MRRSYTSELTKRLRITKAENLLAKGEKLLTVAHLASPKKEVANFIAQAEDARDITYTNETQVSGLQSTLNERGKRYGAFSGHAELTQKLKDIFFGYMAVNNEVELAPFQKEAIEMIFHKLGRIGNGDPNYVDSWVDIAGYAQLVANILEGKV